MPEILHEQYICLVCSKTGAKFLCGRCHSVTYCGGECQMKDLKRHKKLCSPMVYKELDDRGRGFIATRDIKTGDLIYKDKSIMSLGPREMKYYSSSETRVLEEQLKKFSSNEKKRFLSLKGHEEHANPKSVMAIFAINQFRTQEKNDDNALYLEHFFPTITSMTHSCFPNSAANIVLDDVTTLELRALKDIKKGDEVTIDYVYHYPAHGDEGNPWGYFFIDEKHEKIKRWGLNCNCSRTEAEKYDNIIREIKELIEAKNKYKHEPLNTTAAKFQSMIIDILLENSKFAWHPCILNLEFSRLAIYAQFGGDVILMEKAFRMWEDDLKERKIAYYQKSYLESRKMIAKSQNDFLQTIIKSAKNIKIHVVNQ